VTTGGDTKGGDRQDVPHELGSEDFLSSARETIIMFSRLV
jgi:hypothetical protein